MSSKKGWGRLEGQYQVRMARSRSGRKANVKLAWQYQVRTAMPVGKGNVK